MANEVTKVLDPLGKTVYLSVNICAHKNEGHEIYDDAATVIRKPAVLVEAKENDEIKFYYYRSVGWNNTLLIAVHSRGDHWEAYNCMKNPSSKELALILKKGKQII